MSDFYIRQSLHFTTTTALSAEVGIRPGFIAWVNDRRFVATPIDDRPEYPIDGYFVLPGQDGVKWIDETSAHSDLEGSFPSPTVAGVKNLQIVSSIKNPVPHGNVIKSVTRHYANSPQDINPGFITVRKSDLVIVTPGMVNRIMRLTVPGIEINNDNLTLLNAVSVGIPSGEIAYISGYVTQDSIDTYYIWCINPVNATQTNVSSLDGIIDVVSIVASTANFANDFFGALVVRTATNYAIQPITIEGLPLVTAIPFTTTTFIPDINACYINSFGIFVGGSSNGTLMVSSLQHSDSATVEVDIAIEGIAISLYFESVEYNPANIVLISEDIDGKTRVTSISVSSFTVNSSYTLTNASNPLGICVPDFNGTNEINIALLTFNSVSGPGFHYDFYYVAEIPYHPNGVAIPIAIYTIPTDHIPLNIICPTYVAQDHSPISYFITYQDNWAGSFDLQTGNFDSVTYLLDGYSNVMGNDLDIGKESPAQYPTLVKSGDILMELPGSSGAKNIVAIDALTFLTIRTASIVITKIDSITYSTFSSAPIDLIGTPDLSLVVALNGVYDGEKYAWVAGSYNTTSFYIWKIDVELSTFVAAYSLPSSFISIQSIAYAGNSVLVTALHTDNLYKIIKINPANGTLLSVVNLPISLAASTITPDINSATNTLEYMWIGGMASDHGEVLRFNPSSYIHKNNDTVNIETLSDGTTLSNTQTLLNDLKQKFNSHLTQSTIHTVDENDPDNYVTAPDATDATTPISYTAEAAIVNDLKAKINAHFIQANVHETNDTVNTITAPDVTDVTDLSSILYLTNNINYNAHLTQSGVHYSNDYYNISTLPIAVDLATLQLLLTDLMEVYESHRVSASHHSVIDSTNVLEIPGTFTTGQYYTSANLANNLKEVFNYHMLKDGMHYHLDSGNLINATNATVDNISLLMQLTNTIKATFNVHLSNTNRVIHPSVEVNDSFVAVSSDIEPTVNGFINCQYVLNELKSKFNTHLSQPGTHLAISTHTITEPDATDDDMQSWFTAAVLANDLKGQFNNHIINNGGEYHNQINNDLLVTANADSADLLSIINLANELAYSIGFGSYNQHLTYRDYYKLPVSIDYTSENGIGADSNGFIYTSDNANVQVRKFDTVNKSFTDIALTGSNYATDWIQVGTYLYSPCGNTSNNPGSIIKLNTLDNTSSILATITSSNYFKIAYDGVGYLYITSIYDAIHRINITTGAESPVINISNPTDIVNGGDSYMWVCIRDMEEILRISISTGAVFDTISLPVGVYPKFIENDNNLYIWVVGNSIARITKSTQAILLFPENIGTVQGICYDGNGYIYIAYSDAVLIYNTALDDTQTVKRIPAPINYSFRDLVYDGNNHIFIRMSSSLASAVYLGAINITTQTFEITQIHATNDTTNHEDNAGDFSNIISDVTLSAVQTRLNDLKAKFNTHIANTSVHAVADTTNICITDDATDIAPTYPTSYNLATSLRSNFNYHLTEAGLHINNDLVSGITTTADEYRPAAPNPNNNTCLTDIINLTRALGTNGYSKSLLTIDSGLIHGAYNYHLLQSSHFINTILPITSGKTIALTNFDLYQQYWTGVTIVSQNNNGVPYFSTIYGQISNTPPGPISTQIAGDIVSSFDFAQLQDQYKYPHSIFCSIINYTPCLWFLSGGLPDEITEPYRLSLISNIATTSPYIQPAIPYTIEIPAGKNPVAIANGGGSGLITAGGGEGGFIFEFEIVRIAYGEVDYVGDYSANFNMNIGEFDRQFQYPIGGALHFVNINDLIPAPVLPAIYTPLVESGFGDLGTSLLYAREDHVHPEFGGSSVSPATEIPLIESGLGDVGISLLYAREDHVHPAAGGEGSVSHLPCVCASTRNIDINNVDVLALDSSVIDNDRVFLTKQDILSENGPYIYSANALTRPTDWTGTTSNHTHEFNIDNGTLWGGPTKWWCIGGGIVDTDTITWYHIGGVTDIYDGYIAANTAAVTLLNTHTTATTAADITVMGICKCNDGYLFWDLPFESIAPIDDEGNTWGTASSEAFAVSIARVASGMHGGDSCWRVTTTSSGYDSAQNYTYLNLPAGHTYRVTGWVKIGNPATMAYARLQLEPNYTNVEYDDSTTIMFLPTNSTWTYFDTGTFSATTNHYLITRCTPDFEQSVELYMDDWKIYIDEPTSSCGQIVDSWLPFETTYPTDDAGNTWGITTSVVNGVTVVSNTSQQISGSGCWELITTDVGYSNKNNFLYLALEAGKNYRVTGWAKIADETTIAYTTLQLENTSTTCHDDDSTNLARIITGADPGDTWLYFDTGVFSTATDRYLVVRSSTLFGETAHLYLDNWTIYAEAGGSYIDVSQSNQLVRWSNNYRREDFLIDNNAGLVVAPQADHTRQYRVQFNHKNYHKIM